MAHPAETVRSHQGAYSGDSHIAHSYSVVLLLAQWRCLGESFHATLQGLAQDADKYKSAAAHVALSKKMYKRDPATAPVVGDRVPYVIIKVSFSAAAHVR